MNEQFIEHWRQVAEFDYPALQAENKRLTDMHRKAVAEAAILPEEKADRDEEIARLAKLLNAHRNRYLASCRDCPPDCLNRFEDEALAQKEKL